MNIEIEVLDIDTNNDRLSSIIAGIQILIRRLGCRSKILLIEETNGDVYYEDGWTIRKTPHNMRPYRASIDYYYKEEEDEEE